jgi:hypothetical protein
MTIDGISLVLLVFVVICMVVYYWSLWSFAWWLEGQHLRTCRAVMQSEMDAVEKNCTWKLADLPSGYSVITLKWVFKLKRDEAGAIVKHKARLVARGFVQREGIDFDDTFAPWHGWNPCDSSLHWLPRKAGVFITWTSIRRF